MRLFDFDALRQDLDGLGLAGWCDQLEPLIRERLSEKAHGDFGRWRDALDAISVAENDGELRAALLDLRPWRKGPFHFGNVTVDAEWRSDLKWARLEGRISPLGGRSILDVGCGNGWYAIRMRETGARCVIGVDPTLLFNVQFAAARHLTGVEHVHVLPLRLEELPAGAHAFDTTFSMGVLYHRRDPDPHLRELLDTLKPGGELVLETLVAPGSGDDVIVPQDRYARMRNVWHLPTVSRLCGWLGSAGFGSIRVIDVTPTTVEEQRPTEWMTFESLAHALDPDDPSLTIEGLPAPTRAVVVAKPP